MRVTIFPLRIPEAVSRRSGGADVLGSASLEGIADVPTRWIASLSDKTVGKRLTYKALIT
jgi:hypothetical protein